MTEAAIYDLADASRFPLPLIISISLFSGIGLLILWGPAPIKNRLVNHLNLGRTGRIHGMVILGGAWLIGGAHWMIENNAIAAARTPQAVANYRLLEGCITGQFAPLFGNVVLSVEIDGESYGGVGLYEGQRAVLAISSVVSVGEPVIIVTSNGDIVRAFQVHDPAQCQPSEM